MKTTLLPPDGLRLTGFVTLLALASAISVAGCHSHDLARGSAAPTALTPEETVAANPMAGMVPVQPIDDRPVTPMETVGASKDD